MNPNILYIHYQDYFDFFLVQLSTFNELII